MSLKVSLIRCESYNQKDVDAAIKNAVDLIGGIERFVKPGERILLKPNLLSARVPERAVTSHPEVVRSLIRLVKQAKATPLIGDSPGGAVKGVERVWIETGMKKLAHEESVELVNFETSGSVEKKIHHSTIPHVYLAKITQEVDGIINIPKLKTHGLLTYTGAIKNLYGCVPGLRKAEYHKAAPYPSDFSHLLDEIYLLLKDKIRFTLIDGIIGMEGNGPSSGDIRKLNVIAACQDAIMLDVALTGMLGLNPDKIESIHYLDNKDTYKHIPILGNKPSDFDFSNFKFPANWYISLVPHFLIKLIGKYLWLKPVINPAICTSCMMCVNSCPVHTITKEKDKKPFVVKEGCISCLCCHELCPYKAIDLERSWLARILIRK